MKTSSSQISDLYAFTRKHHVEYYDLQTELVDHLANDIEHIRSESPELSFERARDIAFKKFGVYGFSDIIKKRQKAMNKRYWSYIWKELKQWFSIPKVILTVTLFLLYYNLLSTEISKQVFVTSYLLMTVWAIYKTITLRYQYKNRNVTTDKKWLLEHIIFMQASSVNLVFLSQFYSAVRFSENLVDQRLLLIGFSIVLTLSTLFIYISYHILPNKAEELLKKTYPEYSL